MGKDYDFTEYIERQLAEAEERRKNSPRKPRKVAVSFHTDIYVRRMLHNIANQLDTNTSDLIKTALTEYINNHVPEYKEQYPEEYSRLETK